MFECITLPRCFISRKVKGQLCSDVIRWFQTLLNPIIHTQDYCNIQVCKIVCRRGQSSCSLERNQNSEILREKKMRKDLTAGAKEVRNLSSIHGDTDVMVGELRANRPW